MPEADALKTVAGVIKLDGKEVARKEYKAGDEDMFIDFEMEKGVTDLSVYFELENGMQVDVGDLNMSHAK